MQRHDHKAWTWEPPRANIKEVKEAITDALMAEGASLVVCQQIVENIYLDKREAKNDS